MAVDLGGFDQIFHVDQRHAIAMQTRVEGLGLACLLVGPRVGVGVGVRVSVRVRVRVSVRVRVRTFCCT